VSGGADNSPQTLAVSLEVTAAAVLTLVTEPLDVETVVGVDPPVREIVIRNDGGVALNWTATSDAPWMTVARESGTLEPGASETDTVAFSVDGLDLGQYAGTLTFAGDASNSPQILQATLDVTLSPSIALTGTLAFEAYEGDVPEGQPLTIGNDGGGTLHWTASPDQEWVSLSSGSGDTSSGSEATVAVAVDASTLGAGTHTAVITVSGNADDSPRTADVTFVVRERPALAADDVADHLMGVRAALSASELDYLDEIGNGNGSFDVGDFRAWLQREGLMSRISTAGGDEVEP